MGLFGSKIGALGSGLKDSLAEAKAKAAALAERVEVPAALNDITQAASNKARDYAATGREHAGKIVDKVSERLGDVDYDALGRRETYVTKFREYAEVGSEKVSTYFKATFEVDKTTAQMVDDVRRRLPVPVSSVDDIFTQCKREALQRTAAAFFFGQGMTELDEELAARYANLSMSFKEFKEENQDMKNSPNFAAMQNARADARPTVTHLENGYNSAQPLDPYEADIEHIVPKAQLYNDWIFRLGTNDGEIIDLVNVNENLIFADSSLNRSKNSTDLLAYMEANGSPDPIDPDVLHFSVGGQDVTVSKSEAVEKYEKAQERIANERLESAKTIGFSLAESGARMAAQQVVGLILMETIDIFVDEIRDIAVNGKFFDENGLLANINTRRERISSQLKTRFEERRIWARARAAGIEGGVAGVLSAIPQILISLLVQMPGYVLSIIRECTLSTVRCVRVLMSDDADKLASIKVIMTGAAAGVMSAYVSNVISKGVATVPLLNMFNGKVTTVLTGVVVTAVPLGAIYVFEKNKAKFVFKALST
ncbi:hypothetical protein VOM14_18630 [Paraburkholderia sp. MPAMCS5]|uniref:hypothetical protein n=1 Tax=Paraburkholderia sp. MPAMCS5 TaxID=3112563 RepID=UPI002E16BABD|nr:hypothetical protein [Paraburkholderia sp. MPAMCS5]